MTRTRLALAWVVAVALLLTSCGDDDSLFTPSTGAQGTTGTATGVTTTTEAATTAAPPTGTAETATTVETTTTTVAPTTTTTTTPPAAACSGPGAGLIPGGAEEISSVMAHLDGDGTPDEFSAYRLAGVGYLHAQLSSGYATQLALDDAWAAAHFPLGVNYLRVESARSLGSPEQVAVVQLYGGLVAAYGLFAFEDCAVVPLARPDGMLPDLWVGMGPAHSDWPVCGPGPSVSQLVYSSPEGCGDISTCGTPNVTVTEYQVQWYPARLVWVGEETRVSNPPEREYLRSLGCVP